MDCNSMSVKSQTPAKSASDALHNDFRALVGGGWDAVDPAVRARMDRLLTAGGATTFIGTACVKRSATGWLYAQICRAFGAPLVWKAGERVKTTVSVAPTANGLRCWHRHYVFEDGTEQLVQTTKLVDPRLGILDAVGAQGERRLATRMKIWTEGKSLHFESTSYVFRFGRFFLRVPALLTPGVLHAEHRDLGDGTFLYTLHFDHPLWGRTFSQDGIFQML